MYKWHTHCRACGLGVTGAEGTKSDNANQLLRVFDLGIQPLANDFVGEREECAGYAPLTVYMCPRCSLAQLSVVVRPDILYSRYAYVTSTSETMRAHFNNLFSLIKEESPLNSLLEIGSNDGTLLSHFAQLGVVSSAGVDPAENLAEVARKRCIPTVTGTFNAENARHCLAVCRGGFDVILARHVFCHVDEWVSFVRDLEIPSHRNTVVCIEVPHVKTLLDRGEFDTIYHEHLSYLNLRAMEHLLRDSPFRMHRIVPVEIHGGALLIMLRRKDVGIEPHPSVETYLREENIALDTWKQFGETAKANIRRLVEFVDQAKMNGARVCGFGASAKSTVWMSACGFTRKQISYITDTTPQKLWKLSPGTDVPIVDEGAILRDLPQYAICFAWNFREEILRKNAVARSKGVQFVFPVPTLEII